MVIQKMEQVRLKGLVVEAIANLCKSGLSFKSEFCIEGLLGITLDNDDIILMNIKETVTSDRLGGMASGVDHRDLCDLGVQNSLNVTDTNFLIGAGAINTSLDFSKTGLLYDKQDKHDAFHALDLNITSGKLSDLEMLFDLSTTATPGKKRDLLPMDMTTSFLGQESDVDQLMEKENSKSEISDCVDLVMVKEEERERQLLQAYSASTTATTTSATSLPLVALDSSAGQTAESMLLNLKGDDQFAACSGWDGTEYLDAMPLNLSEPQDIQPQDLSTNQTKQKSRHVCDFCGRKFRSESGLTRHRDKEHSELISASPDPPGAPLALTTALTTAQPLDLTTGRCEGDEDDEDAAAVAAAAADMDDLARDLTSLGGGSSSDTFSCICGKVVSDYEGYVDHITNCTKSKLTPCKSCEICGKYFFSNSGYVKHKRLHIGAYKFHCSVCHKGFFDRTHLSAHMDSSHSKVRRYECAACHKSFFWKHHLKRHKITCKTKGAAAKSDTPAPDICEDESATGTYAVYNSPFGLLDEKSIMKIDGES